MKLVSQRKLFTPLLRVFSEFTQCLADCKFQKFNSWDQELRRITDSHILYGEKEKHLLKVDIAPNSERLSDSN